MGVLQEYKYYLLLAVLVLAGSVFLFFFLMNKQDNQNYELSLAERYSILSSSTADNKTIQDVMSVNSIDLLGSTNNEVTGLELANDVGDIEYVDDYTTYNWENHQVTKPSPGEMKIVLVTRWQFTDGINGTMDTILLKNLSSTGSNVDTGLNVGLEGSKVYIYEDEDTASESINDYYPDGVLINVLTSPWVLEKIWVAIPFTSTSTNIIALEASWTLTDTSAPNLNLLGDNPSNQSIGDTYNELGAIAIDNVDWDISGNIVINSSNVNMNVMGSYNVTYDIVDSAGNTTPTMTRIINVVDWGAPIISLLGDNPQTVFIGLEYSEAGATASDNIDWDVSWNIIIEDLLVNTSIPWNYNVTYNVSDSSWNAATEVTRVVNVIDNINPIITLNGVNPQVVLLNGEYTEAGATAIDNVDWDISSSIIIDSSNVDTSTPWDYNVYYSVTDVAWNNAIVITRVITVGDNIAPELTLIGDPSQDVDLDGEYTEEWVIAIDNVDWDISGSVVIDDSDVDTSTPWSYYITYNVSDSSWNAATEIIREINISDIEEPVITLLGNNPLFVNLLPESNTEWNYATDYDPGITATDNITLEENLDLEDIDDWAVDLNVSGSYEVTYTVVDEAWNEATASREVIVRDNTVPVITLTWDNPLRVDYGSIYTELGASASDDVDWNITSSITIDSSSINMNSIWSFPIIYNVIDNAWNSTSLTRTIIVEDNEAPVITLNGWDIELEVWDTYNELGATFIDNVQPAWNASVYGVVDTSTPGTYTLTYWHTDNSGNVANNVIRTVTVVDSYLTIHNMTVAKTSDFESNIITGGLSSEKRIKININTTTPWDSRIEFRLATVDDLTLLASAGQIVNSPSNVYNSSYCGIVGHVFYIKKRDDSNNVTFDCNWTTLANGYTWNSIYNLPIGSVIKFVNPAWDTNWTRAISYWTILGREEDSGEKNGAQYLYFQNITSNYQRPWTCNGWVCSLYRANNTDLYTAELVNNNYTLLNNEALTWNTEIDLNSVFTTQSSQLKYRVWFFPDTTDGTMPTVNSISISRKK